MNKKSLKHIKQVTDQKTTCYVLLTCTQPNDKEEMQVEMSHQGDLRLISYLLNEAQQVIDEKSDDFCCDENQPLQLVK